MKFSCMLAMGITFGLIGATLLVAFGTMYVKQYMNVRTMEEAKCTTTSIKRAIADAVCTCPSDGTCFSSFPCLRVLVNFSTKEGLVYSNATLYDSYETYHLLSTIAQCSFHKCNRNSLHNREAVDAFEAMMNDTVPLYPCYYEPSSDLSFVIKDVVTVSTVIHCMFWPCLSLISGLAILTAYLVRMETQNQKRSPAGTPDEDAGRIRRVPHNLRSHSGERQTLEQEPDPELDLGQGFGSPERGQQSQPAQLQPPTAFGSIERAWNKRNKNYERVDVA